MGFLNEHRKDRKKTRILMEHKEKLETQGILTEHMKYMKNSGNFNGALERQEKHWQI